MEGFLFKLRDWIGVGNEILDGTACAHRHEANDWVRDHGSLT